MLKNFAPPALTPVMRRYSRALTLAGLLGLTAGALWAQELSEAELALVKQLDETSPDVYIPLVTETLTEMGCVMDMNDQAPFDAALSAKVAAHFGFEEELSPVMVETISFRTRPAGMMMAGMGQVKIDEAANTVSLIDCEAS